MHAFPTIFAALALLAADEPMAPAPSEANPAVMVPDPAYVPKAGDTLPVPLDSIPAATDRATLAKYAQHAEAHDEAGTRPLLESQAVVLLPRDTRLLVIKRHDFRPSAGARVFRSGAAMRRSLQADILDANDPSFPPNVLEVRVLDGPRADQVRFVFEKSLPNLIPRRFPNGYLLRSDGDLINKPFPRIALEPARRPGSPPPPPAVRAANMLRIAQRYERAGDIGATIYALSAIEHEFPGTEEAATAVKRLQRIGAVKQPDGRYLYNSDAATARRR
jgi:hypothetical protein